MITKIEASGYRCLREVSQELKPYQILVGPNGSGKSAFLDVIAFLGDVVRGGLKQAVDDRTENFYDLVWGRSEHSFRLAIETGAYASIRYELQATLDTNNDEIVISNERLAVCRAGLEPLTIISRDAKKASFFAETTDEKYFFELHPSYSALANLPMDQTRFPAAIWLKDLLREGTKTVALDNELLRAANPPGRGNANLYNGLHLARQVAQLRDSSREKFEAWLRHVQTAIEDIADIRTVLRPEDRYRYLMIRYTNGIEVPSWMVSDGTLRLLVLTLLAYLPDSRGVYLIEEPEVGVHPTAIETIIQSLSSVYEGQVLIASHSPIVLSMPRPDQLLCFQKTASGAQIVSGDKHPLLQQWKSGVNVSDLFAAGVLG